MFDSHFSHRVLRGAALLLSVGVLATSASATAIDISSGFNGDMVATSDTEGGTGFTNAGFMLASVGYLGSPNLPDSGLVSDGTHTFDLGSYTANNAVIGAMSNEPLFATYGAAPKTVDIADGQYSDVSILYHFNSINSGQNASFTVKYTSGADDVFDWVVADWGSSSVAGTTDAITGMDLYRDDGDPNNDQSDNRTIFSQTFVTDSNRVIDQIVFDFGSATDPSGSNAGFAVYAADGTVVPEPASLGLLGLGSLLVIARRRGA